MSASEIKEVINTTCPWSGKPVSDDSPTRYRGRVVGFCNPGCRDKFEAAAKVFDALIDQSAGRASR
ncbi:glutathione S-transferase [Maricaulis sp.]|nr:glutathione S-transferase [Maricaulis sp.]